MDTPKQNRGATGPAAAVARRPWIAVGPAVRRDPLVLLLASLALALPAPVFAQPEPEPEPDAAAPEPEPEPDAAAPEPEPEPEPERGPDADRAAPAGAASPAEPPAVEPPRLLSSPPPVYPKTRQEEGRHPTVVVTVTLDDHGRIVQSEVEQSVDPEFDAAAIEAVQNWEFAPALREGSPIPSRIRVAVHFELPTFELERPEPEAPPPGPEEAPPEREPLPTYQAHGRAELQELRQGERAVSDFTLERDVLEAAPRNEGADVLRSAPGVFLARGEGEAVGHRIMLRGFDAEHGQDIEMNVGGMPLNQPSHIHGQGYTDLGFLIAETVQELRVTEGVYDTRQGDFAVAGSIDFDLGVEDRGLQLKSSYGSFNSFRQLALWAPRGQERGTFGAVQYRQSDGFGQNRSSRSVSSALQAELHAGAWRTRVTAIVHGAQAELAGVLRREDIGSDGLGYYDVYPHPTAQAQRAQSSRFLAGVRSAYRGERGDNAELGLWLSVDRFRLQENFTGFTQRSMLLEDTAGRGDLIEQQNRTLSLGLDGRYRTAPYSLSEWLHGTLEVGVDGRVDGIEQAQNLLAMPRNQTWDRRVDASIRALDVGFWGELDLHFREVFELRAGIRADVLQYEVDDRLGNFVPTVRPEDFIVGYRRSAGGVAWGPRVSAEAHVYGPLSLLAAYGEGYRSPQARTLEDGEEAPFTKVRSADVGFRLAQGERWSLRAAGYWTRLSDDVVFEAREGRLERVGASRRLGALLYAQARPVSWLLGALSVTYVDAELLEPPPATAEDPTPAFEAGQNLPFVPPVVVRADLGANGVLRGDVGSGALDGRAGLGLSYLSPRPLPYGASAVPVTLLDLSASLGWRMLRVGVEIYNLLDTRYAAVEYNFASHWDPDGVRSRTPARHIAAGAPRTVLATLELSL